MHTVAKVSREDMNRAIASLGDVQVDVVEKAMVVGVSLILGTGIAYVIHVENNIADIIRIT